MKRSIIPLFLLTLISLSELPSTHATAFLFGTGGVQNTIAGLANAEIESLGVAMSLQAGPSGSRFNDSDPQGLGINSSNTPAGITDPGQDKINLITGHPAGTKVGESFSFSFDRPGILNELRFDGVKDETLEYFALTFPDGSEITLFDSQTSFRLGIQGYSLSDLNVPTPLQFQTENDDLTGIHYAFAAGDVFTLKYGEGDYSLVPNYRTNPNFPQFPNIFGDGSRFQGVVIEVVPEPAAATLGVLALAYCLYSARANSSGSFARRAPSGRGSW